MAENCKRTEPVLTQFKNGFELRKLNKRISVILTKEGNYGATFTRILSPQEQIDLKDCENNPYSFITKGKILTNRIAFSKATLIDFFNVLGFVTDALDEMETNLLIPEEDE